MGTLFDQPVRWRHSVCEKYDLSTTLGHYTELAKRHKCSLSDVIALKAVLEQERTNDLKVSDGDIKDEQLGGFGELFRDLIEVLHTIAGDAPWNIRNQHPPTGHFTGEGRSE